MVVDMTTTADTRRVHRYQASPQPRATPHWSADAAGIGAGLSLLIVTALPDAAVRVVLRTEGSGWCRLTVSDSGPGIDEADRTHVFDRFYRATAARSQPGPAWAWPSSRRPSRSTAAP
jgi:Histidine kinase-, DNA gyrase B-, and HSP90-like ATPase